MLARRLWTSPLQPATQDRQRNRRSVARTCPDACFAQGEYVKGPRPAAVFHFEAARSVAMTQRTGRIPATTVIEVVSDLRGIYCTFPLRRECIQIQGYVGGSGCMQGDGYGG